MRRQTLLVSYQPQGTEPSGDPPAFDVTSGPGKVTVLEGAESASVEVSYRTRVTMTDQTHFREEGEIVLDGGTLRCSTAVPGVMEPADEDDTLRGAVLWQVEGTGGLSGTRGLVASTFETHTGSGAAVEHQVLRLYLP